MNSSYIKAKGRNAEHGFITFLQRFWPNAERRRLNGVLDRGDVAGVPDTVIEVKSGARLDLPGWLEELGVEMINDDARYGCVAIKPKGKTRGEDYYCVMTATMFVQLLREAQRKC